MAVRNSVVKKDVYNANIKNSEDKIPDITNLATTTALTTVENKMPDVSNLVNKNDYNRKSSKIKKNTDYNSRIQ